MLLREELSEIRRDRLYGQDTGRLDGISYQRLGSRKRQFCGGMIGLLGTFYCGIGDDNAAPFEDAWRVDCAGHYDQGRPARVCPEA
jgi:hypothetical protein